MKTKHFKVKNLVTGMVTPMTQMVLDKLNENKALQIDNPDKPGEKMSRYEIVEEVDKHGLNPTQAKAFDKKYIKVKKDVLPVRKK